MYVRLRKKSRAAASSAPELGDLPIAIPCHRSTFQPDTPRPSTATFQDPRPKSCSLSFRHPIANRYHRQLDEDALALALPFFELIGGFPLPDETLRLRLSSC
jgi:hypothetical protein